MIVLLASAKTLNFTTSWKLANITQPEYLQETQRLLDQLRTFSADKLKQLMGVNSAIARLNEKRYRDLSILATG